MPMNFKISMKNYLSSAETDHQVSDEGVLCLSRAMADHHTPAVALGQLAAKSKGHMIAQLTNLNVHVVTHIVWSCCSAVDTHASRDSVTEPIWLTLSSRQLQAFWATPLAMRLGLVTVRSSPTTWMLVLAVKLVHASQSSWSKGSSMDTTVRTGRREQCYGHKSSTWALY